MEIWKDIIGYEGHYQISNLGRVKSLERVIKTINSHYFVKENILKQPASNGHYSIVALRLNNVNKNYSIHRLIAIHFIPNPENKPFINHINGIRHDNRIENLEWCTPSENIRHAIDTGLRKLKNKKNKIKIKDYHILDIKERLKNNEDYSSIVKLYGLSRSAIHKIEEYNIYLGTENIDYQYIKKLKVKNY